MKILQVIDRLMRGGGAEKFVLDLVLALNRIADIEVEVLSISPPNNDDFVNILNSAGISHNILSKNLYSIRNIHRLEQFIKNGHFDVVHVHLFPALYYASIAKGIGKYDYKLIYTEHSTYNKRRGNIVFRLIDQNIYKRYDRIVAISKKVKENLEEHLSKINIEIVNNGVDINAIHESLESDIRNNLNIPQNATIITMVSRITIGKDFDTVIRSIETLSSAYHVIFVGDGPMMPQLKERAKTSCANNRIHILGLRTDIFGILKASDIVVLSTHHEGFSIAMLEAMACRKPFVASAVEGIKDLVSNVAELFEYQNSEQLTEIIEHLSEDKEYYNTVARKCYSFANRYDINEVARRYLKLYSWISE